ncbi:hypothetical protein NMY22_g15926 [Coprinellus aureogranulatus]|nr:hypothetical protein NMY22_g15926 [Coprinellus aureogranulatus]
MAIPESCSIAFIERQIVAASPGGLRGDGRFCQSRPMAVKDYVSQQHHSAHTYLALVHTANCPSISSSQSTMFFNLKTIAVTLFASIALAKASASYEPYYERDYVDDLSSREYEDALSARSHIDAALSSLSTRALISELNSRLERRGKQTNADIHKEEAIKRCRKILANAAGKKIKKNAVYPLEECLKKLFDEEGVMPVANWEVVA